MVPARLTSSILLAAILGGDLIAVLDDGAAADFRRGTAQGALLLRNGSVLQGEITRQGDHYLVALRGSGHARVPAASIEQVFDDLEQVYRYKLAHIDGSLASRIDLARWCLQQDLLARAADQILAAEAEHGNSPPLNALHQRLLMAASPPPVALADKTANSTSDAAPVVPLKQAASLEELAPGLIERFTSEVQPLLLNRCTNSGCHSVRAGGSFALMRPPSGRSITKRLTERNLASTLRQLGSEQPLDSPLLDRARRAHGGASTAALTEQDEKQWELLAAWVSSVLADGRSAKPTTIAKPNDILLQAPIVVSPADDNAGGSEPEEKAPARVADYQPLDPFDPEVFNRRFHPSRENRTP